MTIFNLKIQNFIELILKVQVDYYNKIQIQNLKLQIIMKRLYYLEEFGDPWLFKVLGIGILVFYFLLKFKNFPPFPSCTFKNFRLIFLLPSPFQILYFPHFYVSFCYCLFYCPSSLLFEFPSSLLELSLTVNVEKCPHASRSNHSLKSKSK